MCKIQCIPAKSQGIHSISAKPMVHHQVAIILSTMNMLNQPADMLMQVVNEILLVRHHHTITGRGRKGNAERECEDTILCRSQQCH